MSVHLISYGAGHDLPRPDAHLYLDARTLLRDPHVSPALRELTGRDRMVIDSVMRQPGAEDLVRDLADLVRRQYAYVRDLAVAVSCVGGRHRSVVLVDQIALRLSAWTIPLSVLHRDIELPVLTRPSRSDSEAR